MTCMLISPVLTRIVVLSPIVLLVFLTLVTLAEIVNAKTSQRSILVERVMRNIRFMALSAAVILLATYAPSRLPAFDLLPVVADLQEITHVLKERIDIAPIAKQLEEIRQLLAERQEPGSTSIFLNSQQGSLVFREAGEAPPPFLPHDACYRSDAAAAQVAEAERALDTIATNIRQAEKRGSLKAVLVEGSFDHRPLGSADSVFGRSNILLAGERAQCIRSKLIARLGADFGVPIETVISGPMNSQADIQSLAQVDRLRRMAEDRRAHVMLITDAPESNL